MLKRNNMLLKMIGATIVLGVCGSSFGLILVGGAGPMEHDPGLPEGALAVANLASRVSWWEGPPFGGGEYHFQYVCETTEQFNQMLEHFAKVKAKRLELLVQNGPHTNFNDGKQIDCEFVAWVADNFNRLNNMSRNFYLPAGEDANKPVPSAEQAVPAPRVELYLSSNNKIVWERVVVPCEVTVIDRRPESVDKKYAGKGLLRGRITDAETRKPIADAQVELLIKATRDKDAVLLAGKSDAEGNCEIVVPGAGYYQVSVHAKGYVPVNVAAFDNRRPVYQSFETKLVKPQSLKGCVVDVDGKPQEGLTIRARDFKLANGHGYSCAEDMFAITDDKGQFEIKRLPAGFVSLRCESRQLYQTSHILRMWPVPSDDVKLILVGTSTIKGEVIGEDGRRVTGEIIVELEAAKGPKVGTWGYSGRINEDGTFEIKGVPPGDYVLWAQPNPMSGRFEKNVEELKVEPGRVYEPVLTLGRERPRK